MAQRSLDTYREKRDPAQTPEPFGEGQGVTGTGRATGGLFVVQQHAARRLHWDVRLEIDGVLVSWAVPKGPSSDPKEKRLAVQTEDHPLEYADFEGLIPAGNYGAGAMIVWDRGSYRTVDGVPTGDALARGKLDMDLRGHKLLGRWALVRTKSEDGRQWLLIKKADGRPTSPEPVQTQPASILSGLTVEELKGGVERTASIAARAQAAGATHRAVEGSKLRPMLAETVERPFSKAGWIFELKHDGWRLLAVRERTGRARLFTRSGRDITASFPEIALAVAHLPCDECIVDGEVVALDDRGASSFELLQQRLGQTDAAAVARAATQVPVLMYCFDLPAAAGYDLRDLPLETRKEILRLLVPPVGLLRCSEYFTRDGEALFDAVTQLGLEGIVAKRLDSTYQSGRRSRDWLKIKALRTADVAIVGFVRGKGSRQRLGSLMVAWRQDGDLVYAGNVGTGLDGPTIEALLSTLAAKERKTPKFEGMPPGPAAANVFVEPELVAEVRYSEVTSAGYLRQPVLLRVRDDKTIAQCDARPQPVTFKEPAVTEIAAPPAEPRFSNLDKVFWPQDGYTKGDLLRYYEAVWPWIEPYLHDRPVVLTRYPDGIEGKSFFQKNAPGFTPEWVQTFHIEDNDYFICNDQRTLLYVINSGCIPLHVWSARRGTPERPDWAILDLDPKGAPFRHVVQLARHIHALLGELEIPHFVKTSGQDGLHVLVPLDGTLSHAEARMFAEVLARVVAAEQPEIATVARPLGERGGKVYVDFLQNGFGKTIVAPFSVRPRPGAPVSTPLDWRDVHSRLDPARLTIRTVPARFGKRSDPMRRVLHTATDVHAALAVLGRRLQ